MSGTGALRLAMGLALVGGYCDAASFLLVGTFTGHVTGNFVLSAVRFATGDLRGVLGSVLAIACFLLGTTLSVLLLKRLPSRSTRYFFQVTLAIEIVLIVSACFILRSGLPLAPEAFVAAMAVAMGRQNGALRRVDGVSVHTNYLTGVLTTLITGQFGAGPPKVNATTPEPSATGKLIGGIWICFLVGAFLGAILVSKFQSTGVLGAAVVLALMLLTLPRDLEI